VIGFKHQTNRLPVPGRCITISLFAVVLVVINSSFGAILGCNKVGSILLVVMVASFYRYFLRCSSSFLLLSVPWEVLWFMFMGVRAWAFDERRFTGTTPNLLRLGIAKSDARQCQSKDSSSNISSSYAGPGGVRDFFFWCASGGSHVSALGGTTLVGRGRACIYHDIQADICRY
jgi:hypothetical protein